MCERALKYYCVFFQPHSILNKVKSGTSEKEQELLCAITVEDQLTPTLLPVKTVGVQVRYTLSPHQLTPTLLHIKTVGVQVTNTLSPHQFTPTLLPVKTGVVQVTRSTQERSGGPKDCKEWFKSAQGDAGEEWDKKRVQFVVASNSTDWL